LQERIYNRDIFMKAGQLTAGGRTEAGWRFRVGA
jgi:hypothetical protein